MPKPETITMTMRELDRLKVIQLVADSGLMVWRAAEKLGLSRRQVERLDVEGDEWLQLTGKGGRAGKVAMPPLARRALERYLMERGLPVSRSLWRPDLPLINDLTVKSDTGITGARLWHVIKRFFTLAADVIAADHPSLAEKLRRASPHWMRHTHATHALARGVGLTVVRDNLRHASVSTTSVYLHSDDMKRARQLGDAFGKA